MLECPVKIYVKSLLRISPYDYPLRLNYESSNLMLFLDWPETRIIKIRNSKQKDKKLMLDWPEALY